MPSCSKQSAPHLRQINAGLSRQAPHRRRSQHSVCRLALSLSAGAAASARCCGSVARRLRRALLGAAAAAGAVLAAFSEDVRQHLAHLREAHSTAGAEASLRQGCCCRPAGIQLQPQASHSG